MHYHFLNNLHQFYIPPNNPLDVPSDPGKIEVSSAVNENEISEQNELDFLNTLKNDLEKENDCLLDLGDILNTFRGE